MQNNFSFFTNSCWNFMYIKSCMNTFAYLYSVWHNSIRGWAFKKKLSIQLLPKYYSILNAKSMLQHTCFLEFVFLPFFINRFSFFFCCKVRRRNNFVCCILWKMCADERNEQNQYEWHFQFLMELLVLIHFFSTYTFALSHGTHRKKRGRCVQLIYMNLFHMWNLTIYIIHFSFWQRFFNIRVYPQASKGWWHAYHTWR